MSKPESSTKDYDEFITEHKSKYEIITTFQDYLNKLGEESYLETISFIEKHKNLFFKDVKSIIFFMYSILDSSINNFKNFEQILNICVHFSEEIKRDNKDSIESELIGICMIFSNSISYLFTKGFFSLKTIITKSFQNHFIFINFLPEIEKYDEELVKIRKNVVLSEITHENDENMKSFFETVNSDYDHHILNRNLNYHPSSLHKSIRNDDIETFQSLLSKNNIDMNASIPFSFYERTKTIDKNLPPIKVAAIYGSVKIFKFLLMNNAILPENLLCYAYFGTNVEIIHLIENKCSHNEVCIQPIITHNHELFDYYIENFQDKIVEENNLVKDILNDFISSEIKDDDNLCKILNSECISGAIFSYNYPIILSCLHKIVFISTNIEIFEKKSNLGFYFLFNAEYDFDLFNFLYSLMKNKIDIFKHQRFWNTVMFFKDSNSSEAFKLLFLDFKDIIDCKCAIINGIKENFIFTNYILDFMIKEKKSNANQNSLYNKYKSIISFTELIYAIENYNEDIIVKMIQLFDLLESDKNIVNFAYLLIQSVSSKMINSLLDELCKFLPQEKLNHILHIFEMIGYNSYIKYS